MIYLGINVTWSFQETDFWLSHCLTFCMNMNHKLWTLWYYEAYDNDLVSFLCLNVQFQFMKYLFCQGIIFDYVQENYFWCFELTSLLLYVCLLWCSCFINKEKSWQTNMQQGCIQNLVKQQRLSFLQKINN